MTNLNEILEFMLPLIPDDVKLEVIDDIEIAKRGVNEMAVALNFDEFNIVINKEEFVDETGETYTKDVLYCTPELTFKQKLLASHFAYRVYLQKLKDAFTRDAINFNTITFAIKGLEKRPEMINDSLYQVNRYLQEEINRVSGTSSVVGTAVAFGGSYNE